MHRQAISFSESTAKQKRKFFEIRFQILNEVAFCLFTVKQCILMGAWPTKLSKSTGMWLGILKFNGKIPLM